MLGMCGVRAGSRAQVDSQQVAELRSVIPPPSPTVSWPTGPASCLLQSLFLGLEMAEAAGGA